MKLFIAGICGTFMAGLAQIAKSSGHKVSGCDANIYPPMSEVLDRAGIMVHPGYNPGHIDADCDWVIIGNALSRGNPLVEHVLENRITYTSGPQWLGQHVLKSRTVVAVAGTHGKTTTASMVAWILEQAGLEPGFLIGGLPGNFANSARLGNGSHFVIEADEYDTAFFDKRSKFVHYHPDIALLGNLEFDHADIFDDLGEIQRQFHHLVRIVPGNGRLIVNGQDRNLQAVLDMGVWSPVMGFSLASGDGRWFARADRDDSGQFSVFRDNKQVGKVEWQCIGKHNMQNGLAAIAAASETGVAPAAACAALGDFIPTARRLQKRYAGPGTTLYEDFAHHPTAIKLTLEGLRNAHPDAYLLAVIEPRSNTMQMGVHAAVMSEAIESADEAIFYVPGTLQWDPLALPADTPVSVCNTADAVVRDIMNKAAGETGRPLVVVAMSNGSFDRIPQQLQEDLQHRGHHRGGGH